MSANQYLVSDVAPITVHNSDYPYTTMVFNSSTKDTLYLSENPNNNGFPLSPGSSISWDSGKALYLYVNSGVSLYATVVDNGGNLTDAGAIAAQIQISGAPPVDPMTILYEGQLTSIITGVSTPSIDTSKYQSISVFISTDTGALATDPQDFEDITLTWSINNSSIDIDNFRAYDSNNNTIILGVGSTTTDYIGGCTYICATKGPSLILSTFGSTNGATITIRIVGSYKTVNTPHYTQHSNYGAIPQFGMSENSNGYNKVALYNGNKIAGTSVFYPTIYNGNATLFVFAATVTALVNVVISDTVLNVPINTTLLPVSGINSFANTNIIIPSNSVNIRIAGIATSLTTSLVWS